MEFDDVNTQLNKTAASLLTHIEALTGKKILTLALDENEAPFVVDLNENAEYGYELGVKELFTAKILRALHFGGGLTIRQFLPVKVERKLDNGKVIWIPKKNVYLVVLGNMKWKPLSKEQVALACRTNAETGAPLKAERDVYYKELPKI